MGQTELLEDRARQTTADEFTLPAPDDCDDDLLAEAATLSKSPERILDAWMLGGRSRSLFAYVHPNPANISTYDDFRCGCLTMVHQTAPAWRDDALTQAIRRDPSIPLSGSFIRPEHLMRFAQWQTLIRRRYAARSAVPA